MLERLVFYASVIAWYYKLLALYRKRRRLRQARALSPIDKTSGEILQVQKAFQSQFAPPPRESAPTLNHTHLSLWLQCFQSVSTFPRFHVVGPAAASRRGNAGTCRAGRAERAAF